MNEMKINSLLIYHGVGIKYTNLKAACRKKDAVLLQMEKSVVKAITQSLQTIIYQR